MKLAQVLMRIATLRDWRNRDYGLIAVAALIASDSAF